MTSKEWVKIELSYDCLTTADRVMLSKVLQDLDRLEKLEKIFSDLKSMFEIKIGIDIGNEYFMEIKQLDDRIAELIPIEDIEIFKEVLCDE